jgi:hypothetical protein
MAWQGDGLLTEGETLALADGEGRRMPRDKAKGKGLLDVDLSDEWAPFIFSESDEGSHEVKPNAYRRAFIALANDRGGPDEIFLNSFEGAYLVLRAAGLPGDRDTAESPQGKRVLDEARRALRVHREPNFLEAYGIPPTLSVLAARIEADRGKACFDKVDLAGLAAFEGSTVTYQSREQSRREYNEAIGDAAWLDKQVKAQEERREAGPPLTREEIMKTLATDDPKAAARIERYRRGQVRLRAVRALQARLLCEGLLATRAKYLPGQFDLPTNEALADWERKNNIFGWGFLGGETLAALQRRPLDLHFDTFRRILTERLADAAGILEDGSVSGGKHPATYADEDGEHPVPNLLADYTDALMAALQVRTPHDMLRALKSFSVLGFPNLHVAFAAPALPPYYGKTMELSAEIDRGDVWYDLPFDERGKSVVQRREHFPHLTLSVTWKKQKIPLVRWRTTIGSWRSEMHPNGKIYYKYKNSDVGPRVWKDIVAGPVWIPPEGTPAKDLLTRKTLDRDKGAVAVVNTDVMGPGFQSAYGLVMAIHHRKSGSASFFDNQIRTHGSVDYTSIARRFSHGCHRLVNNRAVRLFDFVLRHRIYHRNGKMPLTLRRRFEYDEKEYHFALGTRGYYFELDPPMHVMVTEGNIMGKVKKPIDAFVQKPGVDYSDDDDAAANVGP